MTYVICSDKTLIGGPVYYRRYSMIKVRESGRPRGGSTCGSLSFVFVLVGRSFSHCRGVDNLQYVHLIKHNGLLN